MTLGGKYTFRMLLLITMLFFYPMSLFFAFRAYREFKGLFYDNGMGGNAGLLNVGI